MRAFLRRLPAEALQSVCLLAVLASALRIFSNISYFSIDSRTVLWDLALVLAGAAILGALGKSAKLSGMSGVVLLCWACFFHAQEALREQTVRFYLWASGALSDQPFEVTDATLLVLTVVLLLALLFRLFTAFRLTALLLLAAAIAYIISMPLAKVPVSTADALVGAAAVCGLFFAAQLGKAERLAGQSGPTRKKSVSRKGRDGSRRERKAVSFAAASSVRFRDLLLSCALAGGALLFAFYIAPVVTRKSAPRIRLTASAVEHRIRLAAERAKGMSSEPPVIDGTVGQQLNSYSGAEQFVARTNYLPKEDLYLYGFSGGTYENGVWCPADDTGVCDAMAADLNITAASDAEIWQAEHEAAHPFSSSPVDEAYLDALKEPLSGNEMLHLLPNIYAGLDQVAAVQIPNVFYADGGTASLSYTDPAAVYYEVKDPGAADEGDFLYSLDASPATLYFYTGQIYHRDADGRLTYLSGGDGPVDDLFDGIGFDADKLLPVTDLELRQSEQGKGGAGRAAALPDLAPYLPTSYVYTGNEKEDTRIISRTAFLSRSDTVGLDWTDIYYRGEAIEKALSMRDYYRANGLDPYLQVPENLSRLRQYVAETPLSGLPEITAYIRYTLQTNAVYSLTAADPHDGTDPVEYFLFDSHRGYCEQYASAAVLLYRLYGVPARYASGYRIPQQDFVKEGSAGPSTAGNFIIYRASVVDRDAHAWVEIYLPTVGWTPVEMTVTGPRSAVTLVYPGLTEGELAAIMDDKGWGKEPIQNESQENQNNIAQDSPAAKADPQTAADTDRNRAGGKEALSPTTERLLRILGLTAPVLLFIILFFLLQRVRWKHLRPAAVGRAFERRFRKKGLRIEAYDFAARAAGDFPDIREEDFAVFRRTVLSDAYGSGAEEEEAKQARAFYRQLCRRR